MKNLVPLTDTISYWDGIVNAKILRNRTPLLAIRPAIILRFTEYRQYAAPNNLGAIPATIYFSAIATQLKGCYDTKLKGIELLNNDIRERQQEYLKGECQYCNMNEPSTMDHYLPQADFPEFSALSINLIPCCPTCNTAKGEEWIDGGERRIINYYYDQLPTVNYLFCDILFTNGNAVANFTVNTNAVAADLAPVIANHYRALELLDRYRTKSNGEIVEIRDAIMQKENKNIQDIRRELVADALSLKRRKGQNYWRAVLKIALASSDQFLLDAGFQ